MILDWLSQNIISAIAVVVSVGTLTFTNVVNDTSTKTNLLTRTEAIEVRLQNLPKYETRISNLETRTAVSDQILLDLKEAVTELSSNTKDLTKAMTKVAVIESRVRTLERDEEVTHGLQQRPR